MSPAAIQMLVLVIALLVLGGIGGYLIHAPAEVTHVIQHDSLTVKHDTLHVPVVTTVPFPVLVHDTLPGSVIHDTLLQAYQMDVDTKAPVRIVLKADTTQTTYNDSSEVIAHVEFVSKLNRFRNFSLWISPIVVPFNSIFTIPKPDSGSWWKGWGTISGGYGYDVAAQVQLGWGHWGASVTGQKGLPPLWMGSYRF